MTDMFLYECSCLAGESVHFYDEVHELGKIPVNDAVRRIYMARHIIEKYIVVGTQYANACLPVKCLKLL